MKHLQPFRLLLIALTVGALSPASFAQASIAYRALCQNSGTSPLEPIGDRDGHSISVIQQSCRIEGGPMDAAILTGTIVYEWDKANGTGLAGQAIARKGGAAVVLQLGDFKNTLTMTDGKVTGFLGTGQGTYKLATGAAAVLAGKTFIYIARPSAPGQYVIDFKVE